MPPKGRCRERFTERGAGLEDAADDERSRSLVRIRYGGGTHTSCGRAAVLAHSGEAAGPSVAKTEVGRVPRFCQLTLHNL